MSHASRSARKENAPVQLGEGPDGVARGRRDDLAERAMHGAATEGPLGAAQATTDYLAGLSRVLESLRGQDVEKIVDVLDAARKKRGRIYVIGNGGSAATASHMCSDLGIGLKRRGLANFDIQSLGDNASICTAIANDISYEDLFLAQLEGSLGPEDVLVAISASGNSPNIVKAVEYARSVGATVVGFTGFDGGRLKEFSDVVFHAESPPGAYGQVEDAHMILNHILYSHYSTVA